MAHDQVKSPDVDKHVSPTNELARSLTADSSRALDSESDEVSDPVKPVLTYDTAPWYLRVPFTPKDPPPPRASLDDAPLIPEASANWFSLLTFGWITHLLSLGYARPLEPTDLYKLQDSRAASLIADRIVASFEARLKEANEYNEKLARGDISAGWRTFWWTLRGNKTDREKRWREIDGKKKPSLVMAMNSSVAWWFWSGGILKFFADTSQVLSPLVVKAIINFASRSYAARRTVPQTKAPPVGEGIGLAFALLAMQFVTSFCTHHFFYRSSSTGVLLRGGLITAIYSRSLHLTSRARSTLTNGKLVNHISTDVSRIDFCAGFFHMAWSAPIQLVICLILLLINLGPSALAGFAFFVFVTPVQTLVMKRLFALRQKSMVWTDKRAKLLQELLGGMKVIKFFAWEVPFLKRISEYRQREISYVRSLLLLRSANNAVAFSLPVLAAVLSFVAYSLSGHKLEAAVIFTSLTLFQLLRLPLMFLPLSFSAIADAANATGRLREAFMAEIFTEPLQMDTDIDVAVDVVAADFTWDSPPVEAKEKDKRHKTKKESKHEKSAALKNVANEKEVKPDAIFKIKNATFQVPRGSLCAIVGPVGSGKSSLLQGIIGEMRRTAGSVKFGGTVGYCPQSAWIQNATIRENVCFGRPFDEVRYWKAIKDSCLEPDLNLLPNGDMTEVGEKGISLSGGQKQRLNICRTIYCDTDIQIFDDPLSALDAHVGKAVFQNVLQTSLQGKTRILVTHALHFLPHVDHIFVMVDGRIAERGTYATLMSNEGAFASFVREFGSSEDEAEAPGEASGGEKAVDDTNVKKNNLAGAQLMQTEERNTGAVSGAIYKAYLRAGNGRIILPLLFLSLIAMQGATVMSSYWLVYWQELKWHKPAGFYMGIYAGLGFAQALGFFVMGSMFAFLTYFASQRLHSLAIERVMRAPMSFFETTPLGRIMNRFSKDIDTIDNLLGDALRMFTGTFAQILGAVILISILLPWFLIAVVCISIVYYYFAIFYRSSARELKRLDAILRSSLYSHFSESLSGLATIRAYGETERFRLDNERRVDIENRAYWLTVTNQRWLGIRLDFLGTLLTFVVAILTVAARFTISPSQTGVTLSYILLVQQSFGWMVRQSAEVENDMNGVERIVHYATSVEQEAPHEVPDHKPPSNWPSEGLVELKDVVFKYRPELPAVLKDVSITVRGGEKIGIVGRTGAGKSSIMVALYRLVELSSGSISIDGVDISKLGLSDLRKSISIIPQDPLLFSGTLRSNLDPFGLHDDARLWDALKRAYLVDQTKKTSIDGDSLGGETPSGAQTPVNRFTLDSPVEDEGNNLSVGQRSLVSLARALVKDSKVIVLDEATASVDYETDRNIQDTIAREFSDRTILCIAHRLRTIVGYDRICVLDSGRIAEFDTPSSLFQRQDGVFRAMCDQSSISWDDIRYAVKARETDV
ncbi:ABC transporter [Rickenella mellea]|uniref:ABC transporter n=1 Tax=Rickenella mellea TaxID=50990 RepID=A0A4Y7QKL6_9AGAM|nr:ABC transporter [Rickenella mellea]